ncbi:hypothetical protein GcM1_242088 [Golovinomyces cichoracearum]|uniref:Uncharacterized protein n=1 Tax=Golovinomyces cichoracearum TaxID=62708 RepID=A0A420IH14_9PEZI|nr:hypothetical protein GcM1_242088 [Golovinomyces cichoracearum]
MLNDPVSPNLKIHRHSPFVYTDRTTPLQPSNSKFHDPDNTCPVKVALMTSKEALMISKEALMTSNEALMTSKEALITSREAMMTRKEALMTNKEALIASKAALMASKEALNNSKEALMASKEALMTSKEALMTSKEALITSEEATNQKDTENEVLFGPIAGILDQYFSSNPHIQPSKPKLPRNSLMKFLKSPQKILGRLSGAPKC